MELFGDRRQDENQHEEIEGVEGPAEKAREESMAGFGVRRVLARGGLGGHASGSGAAGRGIQLVGEDRRDASLEPRSQRRAEDVSAMTAARLNLHR